LLFGAIKILLQFIKHINIKLRIAATVILQLLLLVCEAQNNEFKFNLVDGPNSKALGKIQNMIQDRYRYTWFAGEGAGCIYRYNGNRFTIFRHDDTKPNSL
jgi:hypothetical protein